VIDPEQLLQPFCPPLPDRDPVVAPDKAEGRWYPDEAVGHLCRQSHLRRQQLGDTP
jgi:hypothetical protein